MTDAPGKGMLPDLTDPRMNPPGNKLFSSWAADALQLGKTNCNIAHISNAKRIGLTICVALQAAVFVCWPPTSMEAIAFILLLCLQELLQIASLITFMCQNTRTQTHLLLPPCSRAQPTFRVEVERRICECNVQNLAAYLNVDFDLLIRSSWRMPC